MTPSHNIAKTVLSYVLKVVNLLHIGISVFGSFFIFLLHKQNNTY